MFRRLFWLAIGAGFGFGMSFWLMRTVRGTVERYAPDRLGNDLADAVRSLGSDVRAAVTEGRAAMREAEAALRDDLANPQKRRLDPSVG